MKYVRRRFKPHDSRLIAHMPHTLQVFGDDRYSLVMHYSLAVIPNIEKWCNENLGAYLKEWAYGTTYKNKIVFFFTSKDKAVAFKWRWS